MGAAQQVLMSYGSSSGDPHWTQRKTLLHFEGSGGDSSATPHTYASDGAASLSSAQAKFGTQSLLLSSADIRTASSSDFDAGASDFSVQLFARFTANPSSYAGDFGIHLIGQGQATVSTRAFNLFIFGSSLSSCTVQADIVSSSTKYSAIATGVNLALNTWHYFAMVRAGNTLRVGVNGTEIATANVTGVTMNNSTSQLFIGAFDDATYRYYMPGYIDEVRFTNGYAESVTAVPTAAFPDS